VESESTIENVTQPADADYRRLLHLQDLIEHAAHLLPAQGPITAFVHHNTLHAFEHLPFEEAVLRGAQVFGCHPYLTEARYRQELARGRIRHEDIEEALIEDLGDAADELLGFLGTRFHLRQAMLAFPLLTGPTAELRWFVSETEALERFREETPAAVRERLIHDTRHWVMRDLRERPQDGESSDGRTRTRDLCRRLFDRFDAPHIERWSDATWEAFTLHLLWLICRDGCSTSHVPSTALRVPDSETDRNRQIGTRNLEPGTSRIRHRDWLLEASGEDSDQVVHDVLIRFCAAFLDQGLAHWPLPQREAGFFAAFTSYTNHRLGPPDRWLRPIRSEWKRLHRAGMTPLDAIHESLELLGVARGEEEEYLKQTLLALRGFASMIWQMETRGDRVACPAPPGSLVEFIAVRLILERLAIQFVARNTLGFRGALAELPAEAARRCRRRNGGGVDQRAFLVFQMAQLHGWSPQTLARLSFHQWRRLIAEIESFSGHDRRRVYHLAYERRHRMQTLDAIAAHAPTALRRFSRPVPSLAVEPNGEEGDAARSLSARRVAESAPHFQVICCIDEREESLRRHLEEVAPDCQTFGTAGFFAVAMYYRGAADAHYSPLCPVVIKPRHYVAESVALPAQQAERRRRIRRRAIGTVTHRLHLGSRTFAGGWLAAVLGSLASLPLVMRILFPRATAQLRRFVRGFVATPTQTHLQLERSQTEPGPNPGHVGYQVDEMVSIVERLLHDIGLTRDFARLVIVVGHGSSSMNNPHEAAHDCGACGGGRGGPNARAFAQMANDVRVRTLLAERGLSIPDKTWFVGAYHNSCDDSVAYYDLDRLPTAHESDWERLKAAMDETRRRSAHERCRRFESAPLDLDEEAALRHVEGRAEDLSQVRPEYGHATNALCFVGRREWSRGLFLDRRAFLQSYDPAQDDADHTILTRILQAVVPVCAGINLEYYFSVVDPTGYGCGTKLPHNITSLLGVMNGAASDLLPGLPWQMVEIHEPLRLLLVIETTPAALLRIMERDAAIARLIHGRWVQLAAIDPASGQIHLFQHGRFEKYCPASTRLPAVGSSVEWYRGWREHLSFAEIQGRPTS